MTRIMAPPTRVQILNLLRAGFGVEDIALKTDRHVSFVRFEVSRLRATGKLSAIYAEARCG